MAKLILNGATSGSISLESPAVSGTTTLTLPTTTDTLVGKTTTDTLTNKTLTSPAIDGTPTGVGVLTSGTSVSASGTSVNFTSIPSWVKRITVMFSGVSTNGASIMQFQLGDVGGIEATGYVGSYTNFAISSTVTNLYTGAGFSLGANASATTYSGSFILSNVSGTTWVGQGMFAGTNTLYMWNTAGNKTLSDPLTQVRITTVNGTDTFDAGSINILFE